METPDILSWGEIRARLTRVMENTPRSDQLGAKDPCALAVVRLRDIAEYCHIDRKDIYRLRRGERRMNPDWQRTLSWFFFAWERGRLVKEKQADGKWCIVPHHPQPQGDAHEAHAGAPAIAAQVSWLDGRLRVGPRDRSD